LSYKQADEIVKTDEDILLEKIIEKSDEAIIENAFDILQMGLTQKRPMVVHARLGGE